VLLDDLKMKDDEPTIVKPVEKDVSLHTQAENRVDPLLLQWKGVQAAADG
jgi:hypothetical protein